MKQKATLLILLISSFFELNGQRLNIGTQLELAPTGAQYMPVTDAITGKQGYATVASILATVGDGDLITDFEYNGDDIVITTDLGSHTITVNAGSLYTTGEITAGVTTHPTGTDIQTVLEDLSNASGGIGGTDQTITSNRNVDINGFQIDIEGSATTTRWTSTGAIQLINTGAISQINLTTSTGDDLEQNFDITPGAADGDAIYSFFKNTNTTGTHEIRIYDGESSADLQHVFNGSGNSYVNIFSGNFGIGISTPADKLDVNGQIRMRTGATDGYIIQGNGNGTFSWVDPALITAGDPDWTDIQNIPAGFSDDTDDVDDADADPANEYNTSVALNGTTLEITDGGGTLSQDLGTLAGAGTIYQSGDALIKASAAGVTYTLVGGKGTVSVPSGVMLEYVRINEATADLGGATDYDLEIEFVGSTVNQGTVATMMPPLVNFWDRGDNSPDPPTGADPFKSTADNPPTSQVQIIGYGSDKITLRFKNVDSYNNFTVVAAF